MKNIIICILEYDLWFVIQNVYMKLRMYDFGLSMNYVIRYTLYMVVMICICCMSYANVSGTRSLNIDIL